MPRRGNLVFETPILSGGAITGERQEIARGNDIWIPAGDHIQVEQKRTLISRANDNWLEGWNISSVDGDSTVVIGDFKTPEQGRMPSRPVPSGLDTRDKDALISSLLFQLGGKVLIMYDEIIVATEKRLEMSIVKDPLMWKVELV